MQKQNDDIMKNSRPMQVGRIPFWLNKDLMRLALDSNRLKEDLLFEALIDLLKKYDREPSNKEE